MTRLVLAHLLLAAAVYADAAKLRAGVKKIAKPGVPGPIELIGDRAFVVAATRMGDGTNHPVVAATRYGRGRVVAFGQGGYLHKSAWAVGETGRLVRNAVAWSGRGPKKVGVVGLPDLAAFLKKDYEVRIVDVKRLPKELREVDVLCIATAKLGGEENERLPQGLHAIDRRALGEPPYLAQHRFVVEQRRHLEVVAERLPGHRRQCRDRLVADAHDPGAGARQATGEEGHLGREGWSQHQDAHRGLLLGELDPDGGDDGA